MSELKKRARELFLELVDRPIEERRRVLDRTEVEVELRHEVEQLLAAHDSAGSFIETPIMTEGVGDSELGAARVVEVLFSWIEHIRCDPEPELDEFCQLFSEDQRDEVRRHCEAFSARVPREFQSPPDHVPRSIDHCIVLDELGRGMMGIVYLAWQSSLQRLVAIKVMQPDIGGSIRSEAARAAKLRHPGIVPIFHYGEDHSTPFVIMEYSDAGTLADRFRREQCEESRSEKIQSGDWIAGIVETTAKIADALQAAHEEQILHRDLKPQNILIDVDGDPRISDFGLACDLSESSETSDEVAGTLAYMSPEQAMARTIAVDHRSDIFSLGVILYEGLTLRRPFSADSQLDLIKQIASADPQDVCDLNPAVSSDLRAIVLRSLEKDPELRYATAAAFADDLRRSLRGEQPLAAQWSVARRAARQLRRHRWGVLALLVFAAIAVAYAVSVSRVGSELLTIVSDRPVTTYLRPLDVASGEYGESRRLGHGAQKRFRVDRGVYRVVVSWPGGFREFKRELDRPTVIDVSNQPASPEAVDEMVLLSSVEFIAGVGGRSRHFPRQSYRIPEFLMDRHEVTIKQYKAFLDATEHPWPELWEGSYPVEFEDKPVAGIRWESALAYAEYVGKRLPTRLEWQRAARGTTGQLYPWGDEPSDLRARSCVGRIGSDEKLAEQDYFAAYLRRTVRPGELDDRTPEGVEGMYGNVQEWTETTYTRWEDGQILDVPTRRCVMGFSWARTADRAEYYSISSYPVSTVIHRSTVGFRCAKSVDPLNVPPFLTSLKD